MKELRDGINTMVDLEDLADTAYALREIMRLFDDAEGECNAIYELVVRVACMLWAHGDNDGPIRTKHVTASPDIKMMTAIPKASKDPEAYAEFMKALNIPEHLWARDVVRPHWPGMLDFVSEKIASGEPLPGGLDPTKTYPIYKMGLRGKKGVDELE